MRSSDYWEQIKSVQLTGYNSRDLMEYKFPKKTPKLVREFLSEMLSCIHSILQDILVGIYLYGSLAMGCFNPKSSDIDLIIVVRKRLSKVQRKKVTEYLKEVCSKSRRIELSILRENVIQNPQYPTTVDLHFEYWGEIFENKKDKEILSNLYTARKRGFRIYGKPIRKVFSKIPPQYHLRSVIEDLKCTRKYLHESSEHIGYDPAVYWVLGSCRILAFIREEKVLSKLEGGQWGLANLPKQYNDLIKHALCYYQEKKKEHIWNHENLEDFADYMTKIILKETDNYGLNQMRP
jgi:predicted nucleotidyltransferase